MLRSKTCEPIVVLALMARRQAATVRFKRGVEPTERMLLTLLSN